MLSLALHAAQLKRIPRMGWLMRGVPAGGQPENVAAHSYGVVFITLLLLDSAESSVERDLALRIAIVHDLAESLIGDLPRTINRFIGSDIKHAAEQAALEEILDGYPQAEGLRAAWLLYDAGNIPEAQIVKDADRLDMMIQAFMYEQAGQKNLDDFWRNVRLEHFRTPAARQMFQELLDKRAELSQ